VNEYLTGIGRFKEIVRTTGVSTTDLTGKLLNLLDPEEEEKEALTPSRLTNPPDQTFLQTSNRISDFSNRKEPKATDEVVYF